MENISPHACAGPVTRRSFLKMGALGMSGLSMGDVLRLQAAQQAAKRAAHDQKHDLEAERFDPARGRSRAAAREHQKKEQGDGERPPQAVVGGRVAGCRDHRHDVEGDGIQGVEERHASTER